LKLGVWSNDTTLHFIEINNSGCLRLFCVDMRFIGLMNSVIYMTGGTICVEKLKINKQYWVYPFIEVSTAVLEYGVIVEILSTNITMCNYLYNGSILPYKSVIVFFPNTTAQKLNMTISSSLFQNSDIISTTSGYGGLSQFFLQNSESCFYFFLLFFNVFSHLCYEL
jgi:hypothetical protein